MAGGSVVSDVVSAEERVGEIIAQELELDDGELAREGDFVEEYDADSLALITVVARIEKELGVRVPTDELEELTNLRLLAAAVVRHGGDADV